MDGAGQLCCMVLLHPISVFPLGPTAPYLGVLCACAPLYALPGGMPASMPLSLCWLALSRQPRLRRDERPARDEPGHEKTMERYVYEKLTRVDACDRVGPTPADASRRL